VNSQLSVRRPFLAVLFDIDGTLVDSNDAHAHAWVKAFAEAGIPVEFPTVRCAVGMGADKLMPAVAGIDAESPLGTRISERRGKIFKTDPDIVHAALKKTGVPASEAVMIGDTPFDMEAASRAASRPSRSAAAAGKTLP
jgi:phosphoglycolate phosphatase-like HAD superfamily hydrolase